MDEWSNLAVPLRARFLRCPAGDRRTTEESRGDSCARWVALGSPVPHTVPAQAGWRRVMVDRNSTSEMAARDPELHAQLQGLAETSRAVFVAGLPGTGKSLLVHRLAHLAQAARRPVHLLQWDVVRPAIERSPAGAAYPMVDGVTQGVIRIAAGLWARDAVARWATRVTPSEDILIGETPLVGHRFIELARVAGDEAEPFLSGPGCCFAIPIPSIEVRRAIEAERARRVERPVHEREREDAPPSVLRSQWEALARVAPLIDASPARPGDQMGGTATSSYDPGTYERVYQFVLRRRHAQSLSMRALLPAPAISVYHFAVRTHELVPTPDEAATFVRLAEIRFPNPLAIQAAVDQWYIV